MPHLDSKAVGAVEANGFALSNRRSIADHDQHAVRSGKHSAKSHTAAVSVHRSRRAPTGYPQGVDGVFPVTLTVNLKRIQPDRLTLIVR
jgi:hypothetical protein